MPSLVPRPLPPTMDRAAGRCLGRRAPSRPRARGATTGRELPKRASSRPGRRGRRRRRARGGSQFTLPIENADGSLPTVPTAPTIMVFNLADGSVAWPSHSMNLVVGTQLTYTAVWPTAGQPDGTYLAVVSYSANGKAFNGKSLEKVRLGDSRVTGEVAKEATTSKEATAAKDD